MIERLAKRLVWVVLVVFTTTTLAFVVSNVLPGDPARMVAGPQARPDDVARVRKQLGLDKPLAIQYAHYVKRILHFSGKNKADPEHSTCAEIGPLHIDLGKSYQQRRPVVVLIGERLPRTVWLALCAIAIQTIIGTLAGAFAAHRAGTFWDRLTIGTTLIGISAPTFLIGVALQFIFAHKLHLLPLDGFGDSFRDHIVSVILPATTLGIYGTAYYSRIVRDEMRDLLQRDFIQTARAKGLSEWRVVFGHALRNAAAPLVTVVTLELGALIGGAIVTESLFRWPGLGALSVGAVLDRDGPVVMGTVLVTSLAVALSSLLADVLVALFDPVVRAER